MPSDALLIVDDARAIVDTLTKALQRLGHTGPILTAGTPKDALALFRQHKPGIVFVDMDLAGQPGDKVALQILEEAPGTKVLVTTGMDPGGKTVRGVVSAGAYAVIEKPVRLTRLREVLDLIQSEEKGLRRVA